MQNKKSRNPTRKEIRMLLYTQCGGVCPECGCKMQNKHRRNQDTYMTLDHIIPKSKGGKRNLENLRPLCRKCNNKRGNAPISGLKYYKASNGIHIVINGGKSYEN